MAKRQKRSERVKISLTPTQHQHLEAIAAEEEHRPSSYVYELVCQSLNEHPSMARKEVSPPPTREWLNQLGELYGMLDGLRHQLEKQAHQTDPNLLQELNVQIESACQALHSLNHSQAR